MSLTTKAHRFPKYRELGMFLWKYGHSDFMHVAGLDEWLRSNGFGYESNIAGNGKAKGHIIVNGDAKPVLVNETSVENSDINTDELTADIVHLGPTYVRIAQLLSTRPDILPIPVTDLLTKLYFDETIIGIIELDAIIREDLGITLNEAFPTFDAIPISSTPFEQTHLAVLKDGRKVLVKLQKPGTIEKVYEDIEILQDVAEFCDNHTKAGKLFSLRALLDELKKLILSELDYRQEKHNLQHFNTVFHDLDRLIVPSPVQRYSTSRILTVKYIEGRKLREAPPLGLLAAERAALAGDIFRAYLKQILVDGYVHGNPNPDNILLTSTGKLALLDMGIVTRVSSAMQEKLLQLLLAVNEGRSEQVVDSLLTVSERRDNFVESDFRRSVEEVILAHRDSADQLEIGSIFIGIARAAIRCGITLPSELGTLGTTLVNVDKIADLLDKSFDSRKFLQDNVTDIIRGHAMRSLSPAHIFQNLLETIDLLEKLPGKVGRILDSVANNELKVTVHAIDERLLMSGFQKIANRITTGLILASLIMGASQLMQIKTSFTIWGYPGLAILCFIAAAGCGFGLVLEILISDRRTQ